MEIDFLLLIYIDGKHCLPHRLQIQGELSCDKGSGKAYRGMLRTMFGIVREEVTDTFFCQLNLLNLDLIIEYVCLKEWEAS